MSLNLGSVNRVLHFITSLGREYNSRLPPPQSGKVLFIPCNDVSFQIPFLSCSELSDLG